MSEMKEPWLSLDNAAAAAAHLHLIVHQPLIQELLANPLHNEGHSSDPPANP
jgi:hypothetical protein